VNIITDTACIITFTLFLNVPLEFRVHVQIKSELTDEPKFIFKEYVISLVNDRYTSVTS
jgi:hypothetical protein